jgi:hypothetical protein
VIYHHHTYFTRSRAVAAHDNSRDARTTFAHPGGVCGDAWHSSGGMGHGTYNGFNHGGVARTFALHAGPGVSGGLHASTGGFNAGGGFYGGGHR